MHMFATAANAIIALRNMRIAWCSRPHHGISKPESRPLASRLYSASTTGATVEVTPDEIYVLILQSLARHVRLFPALCAEGLLQDGPTGHVVLSEAAAQCARLRFSTTDLSAAQNHVRCMVDIMRHVVPDVCLSQFALDAERQYDVTTSMSRIELQSDPRVALKGTRADWRALARATDRILKATRLVSWNRLLQRQFDDLDLAFAKSGSNAASLWTCTFKVMRNGQVQITGWLDALYLHAGAWSRARITDKFVDPLYLHPQALDEAKVPLKSHFIDLQTNDIL